MSTDNYPAGLRARADHNARKRGDNLTIADLQANPSQLVSPLVLAEVGLLRSYTTLSRAIDEGRFPPPLPDPMSRPGRRRLRWQASVVLEHFGLLPSQCAAAE
jgi:hypothetical protein